MHAEPQIHSPGLGLRTSHTRTNIPTPPSPETPLGPCSASISSWSGNFANSLHNVTCSRRLNFAAANQNRGNNARQQRHRRPRRYAGLQPATYWARLFVYFMHIFPSLSLRIARPIYIRTDIPDFALIFKKKTTLTLNCFPWLTKMNIPLCIFRFSLFFFCSSARLQSCCSSSSPTFA